MKPIKWQDRLYCRKCNCMVTPKHVRCTVCNEPQECYPEYLKKWNGYWKLVHGCTWSKISKEEYEAGIEAEEEYYND